MPGGQKPRGESIRKCHVGAALAVESCELGVKEGSKFKIQDVGRTKRKRVRHINHTKSRTLRHGGLVRPTCWWAKAAGESIRKCHVGAALAVESCELGVKEGSKFKIQDVGRTKRKRVRHINHTKSRTLRHGGLVRPTCWWAKAAGESINRIFVIPAKAGIQNKPKSKNSGHRSAPV